MLEQKEFVQEIHEKIDLLDTKLAQAKRKTKRSVEDGKDKLKQELDELDQRRDTLRDKLRKAGDESSRGWEDAKASLSRAFDEFRTTGERVIRSLRE